MIIVEKTAKGTMRQQEIVSVRVQCVDHVSKKHLTHQGRAITRSTSFKIMINNVEHLEACDQARARCKRATFCETRRLNPHGSKPFSSTRLVALHCAIARSATANRPGMPNTLSLAREKHALPTWHSRAPLLLLFTFATWASCRPSAHTLRSNICRAHSTAEPQNCFISFVPATHSNRQKGPGLAGWNQG